MLPAKRIQRNATEPPELINASGVSTSQVPTNRRNVRKFVRELLLFLKTEKNAIFSGKVAYISQFSVQLRECLFNDSCVLSKCLFSFLRTESGQFCYFFVI